MNGKRKIYGALLLLLAIFTAVALTVAADGTVEYTGSVEKANDYLNTVKSAQTAADKSAALDSLYDYLAKYPVKPDYQYSLFYSGMQEQNLACAKLYLEASLAAKTADEKDVALDGLNKCVKNPLDENAEGYADVISGLAAENRACAALYLADATDAEVADEKGAALDGLNKYLLLIDKDAEENKEIFDTAKSENFNCAKMYLSASKGASAADTKKTALEGVKKYLAYPVDEQADGYLEFINEYEVEKLACANLYVNAMNASLGTAKNGINYRKLNSFVKTFTISEQLDGYTDFKTNFDKKIAEHEKALEKAFLDAERYALVTDYDYAPTLNLKFEEDGTDLGAMKPEYGSSSVNSGNSMRVENIADGDNGYYTVQYETLNRHDRVVFPISNATGGVVLEFDFTIFGDSVTSNLTIEHGGITVSGYGAIYPTYFRITTAGDIVCTITGETVLSKAIVKGEWIHFSLVIDSKTNVVKFYIDYELMCTFNSSNNADGITYIPAHVRIGTTEKNNPNASFSIDNALVYQGTGIRSFDKISKMSDAERFAFYCDVVADESIPLVNRTTAYDMAGTLLSKYWDGSNYTTTDQNIRSSVQKYLNFNYKEALKKLMDENLVEYKKLGDALFTYERKPDTLSSRKTALINIDTFVTNCNDQITKDLVYAEYSSRIEAIRAEIAAEEVINSFIFEVNGFYTTSGVASYRASYERIKAVAVNLDLTLLDNPAFSEYIDAYKRYLECEQVIYDETCIDNSKKIIAVLGFIEKYNSPEQWEANYEYLLPYVTTVRDLIRNGIYDAYYPGLEDALEQFEGLNNYIFIRKQEIHIQYLTDNLARYKESSMYFERFGICQKVRLYIETEEIDFTNETIIALIAELEGYEASLKTQESEYQALLKANTNSFIELCEGLKGNITYTVARKICDEALVYYFAMDVDSAEAQNALDLFVARREELTAVETVAENFINTVIALKATGNDRKLPLILECNLYLNHLETEVEGVASALTAYEKEVNDYNAYISGVNSDIQNTVNYVCYMGNNDEIDSFSKKILETLSK